MLKMGYFLQRFLISGGEFGNRCRDCPRFGSVGAVILDFRGCIWESLQGMPGKGLVPAAIPDFKPRFGNRCKVLPVYTLLRASILDFKPKLGNRCRVLQSTYTSNNL